MKDYLRQILVGAADANVARRVATEYLQARLLQSLQDQGAYATWAFQGGTALRFLYAMPRFSEDLDFALVEPQIDARFGENVTGCRRTFEAEGYDVDVRIKETKTVKSAFVRLRGLPYELGLSPHRSETLSVKVEVDSHPPAGARIVSSLVRRYVILNLRHYDKASLLAGKLHAILTRPYTKGRDIYDLIWYLSDRTWPVPNLELLNNALAQTGRQDPEVTPENWRGLIRRRIETLQWKQVVDDVKPFLERPGDVNLLTRETLLSVLERPSGA
ncbi:MAG: nucleotidyl transferase AbiEii/AbiGii toxin family protein [Phycisphaerae bacterium]|nr:nucleotidyl transferase AbiEii/AbiGii toxin family protein [Phycisphaerae bacterium]